MYYGILKKEDYGHTVMLISPHTLSYMNLTFNKEFLFALYYNALKKINSVNEEQ